MFKYDNVTVSSDFINLIKTYNSNEVEIITEKNVLKE